MLVHEVNVHAVLLFLNAIYTKSTIYLLGIMYIYVEMARTLINLILLT